MSVDRDNWSGPNDANPYRRHDGSEMPTEIESAQEVLAEAEPMKPMRVGGNQHRVLTAFADGGPITAYEASFRTCGDHHGMRREVRRLYMRGYVELLDFTLPNPAFRGRPAVEAWAISQAGRDWLEAHDGHE